MDICITESCACDFDPFFLVNECWRHEPQVAQLREISAREITRIPPPSHTHTHKKADSITNQDFVVLSSFGFVFFFFFFDEQLTVVDRYVVCTTFVFVSNNTYLLTVTCLFSPEKQNKENTSHFTSTTSKALVSSENWNEAGVNVDHFFQYAFCLSSTLPTNLK